MRRIYVTVGSGMCNRLFVIASAMRLGRVYGHSVTVFWTERTGRSMVPYTGPVNSRWEDFFEPLTDADTHAVVGHPKFQKQAALDRFAFAEERALGPGESREDQLVRTCSEQAAYLATPRIVDPRDDLIVVRGESYPFGVPGDPMYKYVAGYLSCVGTHYKDAYLRELGQAARAFTPVQPVLERVAHILSRFATFREVWGIHVRGTDMCRRTPYDRERAIRRIINGAPEHVGFFVASDEKLEWLDRSARIVEYDEPVKHENSVRGVKHALVDLFLLSKCARLYGSAGSSFSMMAWILSDIESCTVHS